MERFRNSVIAYLLDLALTSRSDEQSAHAAALADKLIAGKYQPE